MMRTCDSAPRELRQLRQSELRQGAVTKRNVFLKDNFSLYIQVSGVRDFGRCFRPDRNLSVFAPLDCRSCRSSQDPHGVEWRGCAGVRTVYRCPVLLAHLDL